jgi:NAD(P)-dependent dehydrogenase (short-subunit alcohol dehydrogenase family)
LKPKNIIITGGSSGLGLASATAFAEAGHNITLVARGEKRLLEAAEQLRIKYPDARIEERVLDISNLDQVREFAKEITEPVDILMNNAGLMGPDFELSIEGIESQMATNHIGHFLLTSLIWERLEEAAEPRVISLSSVVHRRGKIKASSVEEVRGAKKDSYDRWQRYADTKLACLLFARELDIRAKQVGSKVKSIAAHPGWALTGLQINYPNRFDFLAQSAEVGARSQIRAATDESIMGGEFIGPKWEAWGKPKVIKGSNYSKDLELMKRLWEISEELTGQKFLA